MPRIKIEKEKCKGCLLCISFCPKGAIALDKNFNRRGVRPVKFREGHACIGCAMCAVICPDCCIEVCK
ncbi:MAG: ferredoxin family protein [Deltaproteobacteria bacterium]